MRRAPDEPPQPASGRAFNAMNPLICLIAGLGLLILLPFIMYAIMYNTLIGLKNRVHESWSDIDTELKRRYDLIPNLVAAVKGYAAHERGIFERVAELRSQAMADNARPVQIDTEKQLTKALGQVLATVEGYPDLKADRQFRDLMHELSMTEDRIQAARRFYNANVRDYNIKIESFPSNIVAGMHHCKQETFFDLESLDMRNLPQVKL